MKRNTVILGIWLVLGTATSTMAPALTDAERAARGEREEELFYAQYGTAKAWYREDFVYNNHAYTIFRDVEDPYVEVKKAGVHRGVKILVDRGLGIPAGLQFYLIRQDRVLANGMGVVTVALKRDANFAPVAKVFIRDHLPNPSTQAISGTGFGGLDKVTITTIHEIGHIFHERSAGDAFWTLRGDAPAAQVFKVSHYARKRVEFVAEVFAGAVIGMQFPQDVWDVYGQYRGPAVGR